MNLAGVEIILNMRRKIQQMQGEVNEFMEYVKRELARGIDDWEQRLSTALVKSTSTDLVRVTPATDATRKRRDRAKKSTRAFEKIRAIMVRASAGARAIPSVPICNDTTGWKSIRMASRARHALRLLARDAGRGALMTMRAFRAATITARSTTS